MLTCIYVFIFQVNEKDFPVSLPVAYLVTCLSATELIESVVSVFHWTV